MNQVINAFKKYKSTKHNLYLIEEDDGFRIRYHWTDIIRLKDAELILDNGGFITRSTKKHMNEVLRHFHMLISQNNYEWTVFYGKKSIPFERGMKIHILDTLL
jgi:hypothetical protein